MNYGGARYDKNWSPTEKPIEVTVTSINLADVLVILLIFDNDEHFVNAVTMGKVSCVDKMRTHADAA